LVRFEFRGFLKGFLGVGDLGMVVVFGIFEIFWISFAEHVCDVGREEFRDFLVRVWGF